jgi:hypothetical protein
MFDDAVVEDQRCLAAHGLDPHDLGCIPVGPHTAPPHPEVLGDTLSPAERPLGALGESFHLMMCDAHCPSVCCRPVSAVFSLSDVIRNNAMIRRALFAAPSGGKVDRLALVAGPLEHGFCPRTMLLGQEFLVNRDKLVAATNAPSVRRRQPEAVRPDGR